MRIFAKTLKYINKFQGSIIMNTQIRSLSTPAPVKLAFSVYNESGTDENAPAIIIIHGLLGSKQNWRSVAITLNKKLKRKIYTVDARNHGESPHATNHDAAHLSEDLRLFIENMNLRRVSVIGHSMGGKVTIYFSMKYPQLVEKVIIVDISPVSDPKNLDHTKQALEAMKSLKIPSNVSYSEGRKIAEKYLMDAVKKKSTVDYVMHNFKKAPTGEFLWRVNVESLLKDFDKLMDSRKLDFPPFSGPVMFIVGKRAGSVNSDDIPRIRQMFPNASFEWFVAGHLVHRDKPKEFIETVTNFLNK